MTTGHTVLLTIRTAHFGLLKAVQGVPDDQSIAVTDDGTFGGTESTGDHAWYGWAAKEQKAQRSTSVSDRDQTGAGATNSHGCHLTDYADEYRSASRNRVADPRCCGLAAAQVGIGELPATHADWLALRSVGGH